MHYLLWTVLIGICSKIVDAQLPCGTTNHSFSRFDLQSSTDRLVGGIPAKEHAWPWVGELLLNGKHHCGCSLIEPSFIVTAAHCFAHSREPKDYKVLLGGHNMFSGQEFSVVGIAIHPLYQIRASAYDIALIKITPPAELTPQVNTICLGIIPPVNHQVCVVAGWGRIQENGEKSTVLREIHVPIVPTLVCNDFQHYAGLIFNPTMFCAGYPDGRMDACQGDSGGPLMCLSNGIWQLQGIVSWGIGCAKPNFPGVYTKVAVLVGWIKSQAMLM